MLSAYYSDEDYDMFPYSMYYGERLPHFIHRRCAPAQTTTRILNNLSEAFCRANEQTGQFIHFDYSKSPITVTELCDVLADLLLPTCAKDRLPSLFLDFMSLRLFFPLATPNDSTLGAVTLRWPTLRTVKWPVSPVVFLHPGLVLLHEGEGSEVSPGGCSEFVESANDME